MPPPRACEWLGEGRTGPWLRANVGSWERGDKYCNQIVVRARLGIVLGMVNMLRTISALLVASTVGGWVGGVVSAQEPLTIDEALSLRQVVNPKLGDGFVAFNLVVPRPVGDGVGGSYLNLGVIDQPVGGGGAEKPKVRWLVANEGSAPGLAIRPGSKQVSYTRRIDGRTEVVVRTVDGSGEPEPFAETPSLSSYRWRPDGQAIAFTVLDELPPGRQEAQERGFRPVIVDEDWRHVSLWMVEAGGKPVRLTEGTTVIGFEWAPNGKSIACACAPANTVDASYMQKRLHVLDIASGKLSKLVDNPGKLGDFAWSADGKRLAYISAADRNDPHAGMLYMVEVASKDVQPLTHGFTGMVQHVHATVDGFLCQESIGVRTRLRALDPAGKPLWMYEPKISQLAITGFSSHVSAGNFVFTASHSMHPAELFVRGAESSPIDAERLTVSNPDLAGHKFGEQRVVRYRTRDGLMVEGILVLPIDRVEGTRYPLVIVAHGGPESHYSNGWLTSYSQWGHLLAARGIASWYPNYRSSTGYGVAFCKHDHGDPMGKEFDDHLDAIAHFDKVGLIDKQRVGIGGGSYGGYTAAWAATRASKHFAAAVSFVPFVDMRTKWMTTDIPMEFYYVHYQEKWPWQQPGLLADRSPLNWAPDCDTPLLVLGGTSDPRVHPSQPFMLYRAVKFATDTPVRYVQYTGEGHGNRKNVNRIDYCVRTLRWFEHYLLGGGDRRSKALPPMDVAYPE